MTSSFGFGFAFTVCRSYLLSLNFTFLCPMSLDRYFLRNMLQDQHNYVIIFKSNNLNFRADHLERNGNDS